jgi:hypothetical protein
LASGTPAKDISREGAGKTIMISLVDITHGLPTEEQDHIQWICEAIAFGLAPWNPGEITTYYSDTYGCESHPFEPIVTFETKLLPRLLFSAQIDLLSDDMHQALLKVADQAFEFYRYRPATPVDDHIILGEE